MKTPPGVATAQFRSFAAKIPPFYASLAVTMLSVMFVFAHRAPAWLALGVPGIFIVLLAWRGWWWLDHRHDELTDAQARRHLARATTVLIVCALVAMGVDVMLFKYADVHAKYFILMQIVASTMAGFFCLMHLRAAAALVAFAMMLPFIGFMLCMGDIGATASAVDIAITVGLMSIVMFGYQRDFANLIRSEAETSQLSRENVWLANLDMLTGLPNRRQFFEELQASIASATVTKRSVAVGIVDLDGFKPVNDTHGHRVGDHVLAEIARRIEGVSSHSALLARVGGDEFAFIVTDADEAALLASAEVIIQTVSRPITVGNLTTSVGCSIGFAVYPNAAATADLLYERADYALYHAKRSGRSRSVMFSVEHEQLLKEQGAVEQALRSANLADEFYPVFQPIVDAQSKRTLALESLARWQSPVLGAVPPGTFIPIAEQAGIIAELTPILLQKSLAAAELWPEDVHLSFNVSPYDISSEIRTRRLIEIIKASRVPPHRVAIELTETALLHSFVQTNANMALLQAVGVRISLDDFGTGYSSLSYVHALPFNKLKIDKRFIGDIEANPRSRNIVRSLITLCHDLGVTCIIEGVETTDQLRIVRELGGAAIQGYYFARPMPAANIDAYLRTSASS
ncbi:MULTISPECIES: EAL domain-containing protein [unclassified Caballeronia]|uniref:putative bifunctional diguanylate cyclase/phosphodiesterase n=1 Tax=unclassified Caballeronia TaxID=2646786 RepID=UPI002855E6A2|nr:MULTISPECIES: EAL domain-containing protein [unclassified Caballeronia]MDR5741490.1 EAL domain-containing protein [Caballeronia sp. LZ016]MDR5806802.1 EAL domain-containing protein [Caballeronia sp. LZ019]